MEGGGLQWLGLQGGAPASPPPGRPPAAVWIAWHSGKAADSRLHSSPRPLLPSRGHSFNKLPSAAFARRLAGSWSRPAARVPTESSSLPPQITRCPMIPCYISSMDECLWMDWVTEKSINGHQAKFFACIKRNDGSCAWYRGAAPPKQEFLDIQDP